MDKFLTEFNKVTENKFSYLRVDDIKTQKNEETKTVSLTITFVVPYEIYNDPEKFNNDIKAEIENAVISMFPSNVVFHFKYDKIQLIPQVVTRLVSDYIREKYLKLFDGKYFAKDIAVSINGDVVQITIPVDETIYYYCQNKGVGESLIEYLDSKYSAKNFVKFKSIKMPETEEFKLNHATKYVDDGLILYKRGLPVVGTYIADPPMAVNRFKKPVLEATTCGYIINIEKKTYNSKKDNKSRLFYIIDIKDPLDCVMHCLYFVKRATATKSQADKLKAGQSIVVNGEIVQSNFNNSLNMFIRNISNCEIDMEGTKNKFAFLKKLTQKANIPEPKLYKNEDDNKQYTLFDEVPYICPMLREKEFTVFDLETTGLIVGGKIPKIVEIGAAKIVNGEIVSTFETLVDPQEHIPEGASNVNKIYDNMVESAPIIDDAIGPFLKFALGTTLVGHNAVNFDAKIVEYYAKENGYSFEYPIMDTLKLAIDAGVSNKYMSLDKLCKHYGVENEQAHRALGDVIATAKVFIKLANQMKME